MKNIALMLSVLCVAACGGGGAQELGSEEAALMHGHGEWDVTVRVTVPTEVGDIESEALSITTCVDVDNPAPGYKFTAPGFQCEGRAGLAGQTLRWQDDCQLETVRWRNEGRAEYDENSFEGEFTVFENGQRFAEGTIRGLRIGDC